VANSEILDEYDFSKGIRGKYTQRYVAGSNLVEVEDYMEEIREDDAQEKEIEEESSEARPKEEEQKELTPDQEMARMQQEVEQANDMMLRLAAELDNYKKRVAKERESLIRYAAQDVLQELIPVLDNFERAIEAAGKSKDFDSFLEGVKMIYKNMYDVMGRKGLARIDAVGETFDPNIHEAVMQVTSQEHPENIVVEELQKGYVLHDRVIRPSMVVVSKGKGEESNG
jgi:molecular chaperone GrpE